MRKIKPIVAAAFLAASSASASAEELPAPAACTCIVIPALTSVSVEILASVGSKISESGDIFPIRLATPIVIEGNEVVPTGAPGIGEVVHAKKAGGSGTPGELVLAARYIEFGGRRLRLRSFNLTATGQSRIAAVDLVNAAGAGTMLPVGLLGFLVNGGQVTVPQGTIAQAKTYENFEVLGVATTAIANSAKVIQ